MLLLVLLGMAEAQGEAMNMTRFFGCLKVKTHVFAMAVLQRFTGKTIVVKFHCYETTLLCPAFLLTP